MERSIVLVLVCLVLKSSANPVVLNSEVQPVQDVNYRLTDDVTNLQYEVTLTPYLETEGTNLEWTFDGSVKITFRVNAPVNEITLHAFELDISSFKIYSSANPNLDIYSENSYDNTTQKLTLKVGTAIATGQDYVMEMNYVGYLNDEMRGFYRSTYMENNIEKRMASTQFQPVHARRAFPCFDEPKYKANFVIKIRHLEKYHTLSNMPKQSENVAVAGTNKFEDTYFTTPSMSTYLIAFIVSEYVPRQNIDQSFGVWARPEMESQTKYAFDVGVDLLNYFNSHLDMSYSTMISKMDMVAIPDFSAGAMENWGLLTYRERYLLFDEQKTTPFSKQLIGSVIAHEQAHQWFGDIVTCDWWSYTWLNEGFATFFEYFGTSEVEKDWDIDLQFVPDQLQVAFILDSSNSTHPLNHNVNSPGEISGMFDAISYNKGGSVLRMVEHVMGKDLFLAGIRQYLKTNEYKTATPDNLYAALQEKVPHLDLTSLMKTWTDQEGYPVLNVGFSENRNIIQLTQKRFLMQNSDHDDKTLYQIPITYTYNLVGFEDIKMSMIMAMETASFTNSLPSNWVIMNVQHKGFYRVNYDKTNWYLIRTGLMSQNHDGIHVLNRAQIVDDVLNLARADYLSYDIAFDVLDYLDDEQSYIPWFSAFNALNYYSRRLGGSETGNFGKYIRKKLSKVYDHLGFDSKTSDSHTDRINRATVLQWLCKYDHEGCVQRAQEEFNKAKADSTYLISLDARQVSYCIGVRNGGAADFNWLWERFTKETMATEQAVILNGLGCTNDDASLKLYLDNIFSSAVRKQDKTAAFTSTLNGHDGNVDRVWSYVRENHAKIADSVGSYGGVASLISTLASRFTSQEQLNLLEEFAETTEQLGASKETLTSAINTANYDLHWARFNLPTVESFLAQKGTAAMMIVSLTLVLMSTIVNFVLN